MIWWWNRELVAGSLVLGIQRYSALLQSPMNVGRWIGKDSKDYLFLNRTILRFANLPQWISPRRHPLQNRDNEP